MTVAARLAHLAAQEETITMPVPKDGAEMVDRAYHEGRRTAFSEAAQIVAAAERAGERKRGAIGRLRGHDGTSE